MNECISQPLDPSLMVEYNPKPVVICLFKSLSDTDFFSFQYHGKVIRFGPEHRNLPFSSFSFDYFIIDLRQEEQRFYFQRHIIKYTDSFSIILYRHCFETTLIPFHNQLTDIPAPQINKEEFNLLLLDEQLPAPNCLLSLCRYVLCK